MAVNAKTLAAARRMRIELDRYVDGATRDLAKAWSAAWQEVISEWQAAVDELVDMAGDDWPTRSEVLRAQRAQNALKVSVDAIRDLAKLTGVRVTADLAGLTSAAETWQQTMALTQIPSTAAVGVAWDRVDAQAMWAIVKRTTQQVTSLARPITAASEAQMKSVLVRGVAVGDNPKAAARLLMKRSEGAFNGGLARATNIARTEMLDSSRAAALASRKANADVLQGWTWLATLDKRTCPSCLSQNGSTHALDEAGPNDHQQGRCSAVPITKSWRSLGIDLDEPPASGFPDAEAWFKDQPTSTREQIMGKERLRQYENGTLRWHEMSQKVSTPGWRDSIRVRPLHTLGTSRPGR